MQRVDLPRVIDTGAFFDARAAEVQALQQVLSTDCRQANSQYGGRQGRRRTTSYKSYRHTRRPNKKLQGQAVAAEAARAAAAATGSTAPAASGRSTDAEAAALAPRPMSRAMRRRPGRLRAAAEQSCATEPAGPGQAGASLRKLETHLWHAKRMTMQDRWGHLLPEGAVGKGHGSRHLLQQLHSGCLLHDASYWCPLQLAGSRDSLLSLLQATMEPGIAEQLLTLDSHALREHDVILHHPSQWPRGTIGPAHTLLLPPQHATDAAAPLADGKPGPAGPARLWLWLHPAAYHEALAMLQRLSQPPEHAQQQQQPDAAAGSGVTITPLARHLRRLELRGPSSTGLLAGLLPDITALSSPPAPAGTALACQIEDPRLATSGDETGIDAAPSENARDGDTLMAEQAEAPSAIAGAAHTGSEQAPLDNRDVWEQLLSARPPHSESQVSSWRQQRRLAALGLGAMPAPLSGSEPGAGTACLALLIRRRTFGTAAAGYSLVVSAQWVMPLWGALLRRGGVPVGQREWRWVAADQGCTAFPWDFPDTRAGAALAAEEAAVHDARRVKATKAKQLRGVPQWDRLAASAARQPSAGPQQAAPSQAAADQGVSAVQAAAAPADEQPEAVVQPAAQSVGIISADEPAEPTNMDVDGAAPSVVASAVTVAQPAAAGIADAGNAVRQPALGGSAAADETHSSSEAASLLPTGWGVARGAAALLQALPQTSLLQAVAAAPQQHQHPDASRPDAPATGVNEAGPPSQAAGVAHMALSGPITEEPAAGGTAGGMCMARVRLRMTGHGVADPGAALCGPAAGAGCSSSAEAQHPIGFVMAPAVRGACAWAGASALCSAAALDRLWQHQQELQRGSEQPGPTRAGQRRQPAINLAVVHPTTGEYLPAQAFLALHGRAGDASV